MSPSTTHPQVPTFHSTSFTKRHSTLRVLPIDCQLSHLSLNSAMRHPLLFAIASEPSIAMATPFLSSPSTKDHTNIPWLPSSTLHQVHSFYGFGAQTIQTSRQNNMCNAPFPTTFSAIFGIYYATSYINSRPLSPINKTIHSNTVLFLPQAPHHHHHHYNDLSSLESLPQFLQPRTTHNTVYPPNHLCGIACSQQCLLSNLHHQPTPTALLALPMHLNLLPLHSTLTLHVLH